MSETLTSEKKFEKVSKILEKYNYDKTKLIPILQETQEEYRYLPEELLSYIGVSLNISSAKVFGVATFYAHFSLEPKGKYIIKVCDGTACHVKKSTAIIEAIEKKLKLSENKKTTPDLLFTLEKVSCLGACGIAPVVLINYTTFSQCTPEKILGEIEKIIKLEKNNGVE